MKKFIQNDCQSFKDWQSLVRCVFTLAILSVSSLTYAQDSPAQQTLRDNKALTDLSAKPEIKRWEDSKSLPRNYAKQPPVIPHTTKGYVINLKFNKCLTCHSDKNAPISGAPPVGMSHYSDRNAQLTTKISGRRYFCVQCHVPQMETEPLVPNDFQLKENAQ